jgi:hypothetical protein
VNTAPGTSNRGEGVAIDEKPTVPPRRIPEPPDDLAIIVDPEGRGVSDGAGDINGGEGRAVFQKSPPAVSPLNGPVKRNLR